jgi:hypothetical protein
LTNFSPFIVLHAFFQAESLEELIQLFKRRPFVIHLSVILSILLTTFFTAHLLEKYPNFLSRTTRIIRNTSRTRLQGLFSQSSGAAGASSVANEKTPLMRTESSGSMRSLGGGNGGSGSLNSPAIQSAGSPLSILIPSISSPQLSSFWNPSSNNNDQNATVGSGGGVAGSSSSTSSTSSVGVGPVNMRTSSRINYQSINNHNSSVSSSPIIPNSSGKLPSSNNSNQGLGAWSKHARPESGKGKQAAGGVGVSGGNAVTGANSKTYLGMMFASAGGISSSVTLLDARIGYVNVSPFPFQTAFSSSVPFVDLRWLWLT